MNKYPWSITLTAVALGAGISALSLALDPQGDYTYQFGLLATVRASAICFLAAFLVGPLFRMTKAPWLRPLLANRRYLGLSFAILHSFHLAFILLWMNEHPGLAEAPVLILGGGAYAIMYLMALTSNDWSVKTLGRNWGRLHTIGVYYLWAIMTITFIGHDYLTARLFTLMFFIALIVRLMAFWQVRKAKNAQVV